jgi:monofunctional biosynthetic peptidoglycan transglycosylase
VLAGRHPAAEDFDRTFFVYRVSFRRAARTFFGKCKKEELNVNARRLTVTGIMVLGLSNSFGGTVEDKQKTGLMEHSSGGWSVVNDDVMGGMSQSRAILTDRKTLRFSGDVSLENNGGFASIRHVSHPFGIGTDEGIRLSIKGDGKKYQLRVRTSDWYDGVAYKADFTTLKGEWKDLMIPWSDFTATFRGQPVPGAPALKGDEIRQIGFLIADNQAGTFELEIADIGSFQ